MLTSPTETTILLTLGHRDGVFDGALRLKEMTSSDFVEYNYNPSPPALLGVQIPQGQDLWDNAPYQKAIRLEFNRVFVPEMVQTFAGIRSKSITVHLHGHGQNVVANPGAPKQSEYVIGTIAKTISARTVSDILTDMLDAIQTPELEKIEIVLFSCHSAACDAMMRLESNTPLSDSILSASARTQLPEIFDTRVHHSGPLAAQSKLLGPEIARKLYLQTTRSGIRARTIVRAPNGAIGVRDKFDTRILPGSSQILANAAPSDVLMRDAILQGSINEVDADHLSTFVVQDTLPYSVWAGDSIERVDNQIRNFQTQTDQRQFKFKTLVLARNHQSFTDMLTTLSLYDLEHIFQLTRLSTQAIYHDDPLATRIIADNIEYGLEVRAATHQHVASTLQYFDNSHELAALASLYVEHMRATRAHSDVFPSLSGFFNNDQIKAWYQNYLGTTYLTPEQGAELGQFLNNLDALHREELIGRAVSADGLRNDLANTDHQLLTARTELTGAETVFDRFKALGVIPDKNPNPNGPGAEFIKIRLTDDLALGAGSSDGRVSITRATAQELMYNTGTKIDKLRASIDALVIRQFKLESRLRKKPGKFYIHTTDVVPFLELARRQAPKTLARTWRLKQKVIDLAPTSTVITPLLDAFRGDIDVEISDHQQPFDYSSPLGACGGSS